MSRTGRAAPSQGHERPDGAARRRRDDHEVPDAEALPRRPDPGRRLPADGPVDAGGGRRPHPVHARLRRRAWRRRASTSTARRWRPRARSCATTARARPPVADGPFAETKDLIAGWMIIDVESWDRAVELAGELSAAPGPGRRADPRVARGPAVPHRVARDQRVNDALLRELVPAVIGVLVRRGADFASAEDAVQEALVRALATWPDDPPRDPKGWLVTAAWRRFLDDAPVASRRAGRASWRSTPSRRAGPGAGRRRHAARCTSCARTRRCRRRRRSR